MARLFRETFIVCMSDNTTALGPSGFLTYTFDYIKGLKWVLNKGGPIQKDFKPASLCVLACMSSATLIKIIIQISYLDRPTHLI